MSTEPTKIILKRTSFIDDIEVPKHESSTFIHDDTSRSSDSEESYLPLYTSDEMQECITFLNFNTKWTCISTLSNVILLSLILYRQIFGDQTRTSTAVFFIIIVCDGVIIIDVLASIVYYYSKTYARRRCGTTRHKALIILDILSLLSIPLVWSQSYHISLFWINCACIVFRNYRIGTFFYVLSKTAGKNTLAFLTFKYGLVSFAITHICACIWMSLGCFDYKTAGCEDMFKSWTHELDHYIRASNIYSSLADYVYCMLYAISSITTMGLVGPTEGNFNEQVVSIVLMLIGFYLINGLFVGAFTSVQIESYRRQAVFANKLELISNSLSYENISRKLKKKIKQFYIHFWHKKGAMRNSLLLLSMPESIRDRVFLDKYWEAINKSSVLKDSSEAFKRALSRIMFSEIYNTGEVVYAQDKMKQIMMFVARGSVEVLSSDDTESPLLSMGMGSCIGGINLVYSLGSSVQVVSTSYSIMFCLKKSDLWKMAHKMALLKPSESIHEILRRTIRVAKLKHNYKEQNSSSSLDRLYIASRALASSKVGDAHVGLTNLRSCIRQEAISELYVINKEEIEFSHHDGIFIRTTFPWILRPNSQFLYTWECFFVMLVFVVAFFYPWQIVLYNTKDKTIYVCNCLVCLAYTVDFLIKLFTAINDDKKGLYTKLTDLIPQKCSKVVFVLDVLALIPFDLRLRSFGTDINERTVLSFFLLNRSFMIYRVVAFIRKLENSFTVNVALVRCTKYVIYLIYLSYIIGIMYYMIACDVVCSKYSWVERYKEAHKLVERNVNTTYAFETAMLYAMLLLSGTGGKILTNNVLELCILTTVCIIGTVVFSYLVADYSATLTLAGRSRSLYIEMIEVIRKFMTDTDMPQSIQNRMNHYLEAQWIHNKGITINKLLVDAPGYLYNEYQHAKYAHIFTQVPLFQELTDDSITEIASACETLFFPPNEFITYSREVVKEMYIIEKGFCEIISPASGRIEKIIGPESVFSVIDMILELPGVFHVRTVTHVSVIKISYDAIKHSLTQEDRTALLALVETTKQSFTVQRLFTESTTCTVHKEVEEDVRSWVMPPDRWDPRRKEYIRSWKVFRFCRYIMMPYTIMPYGQFIAYYEIFRACCAFISAMTLPMFYFYQFYFLNFYIFQIILDLTAYADLYIRMHVCYYNNKGILVTHPRATAYNYFCGSFFIDFVGCLPSDYFLSMFWRNNFPNEASYTKMCTILKLNRIVQIYRIPDAFAIFSRDIMKSRNTTLLFIKLLVISLALFNFISGIFVSATCAADTDTHTILPYPQSWLYFITIDLNITVPANIYLITYYFMSTQSLQIGFGDINAFQKMEITLVIIIIISGYLWFTYVLVIISNSKAAVNVNLTLYQNHMKQLISFMRQEKIDKSVQKCAINHLEYVWQRTHGLRAGKILKQCHLALSKDCALHLYESTLKEVPIFKDMVTSFYRVIGTNLEEHYFLRDNIIIKLNDIVNTIYIVHKGQVKVIGPDGCHFATLSKGGMFGNIDEVKWTRSMITVVAITLVDLLEITTGTLYSLINPYPIIVNRLRKHILLDNLSYIESKYQDEDIDIILKTMNLMYIPGEKIKLTKRLRILCSRELKLILMLASLLSCMNVSHQASFQDYMYVHFGISYFLDFVHLIKLYLGFVTPYQNHMGDMVIDSKSIIRRYLKFNRFYIELAGCIPTDLLYFALPTKYNLMGLTILRLNRLLRLVNVYNYFNITHDYLNINVLVIKLSSIFIVFTLLVHFQACLWYLVACPLKCYEGTWVVGDSRDVCVYHYICAIYFATSVTTFTGYSSPHPKSGIEIVVATILLILNKFVLGIFIGNMTSIVHNVSSTLIRYDHGIQKLKEFLRNISISEALTEVVLQYTYQLWDRNKGLQIPVYLKACPYFLEEQIKISAFGHHIYENELFAHCHKDFLRLLIGRLRMRTFFHEDIICHQGDVNDTMYFIHEGQVKVYTISDTEEVLIDELDELDSFGTLQGMFSRIPHTHTYKAFNVTVVLLLMYSDWYHLMEFYPASKYMIYEKIKLLWNN